MKPMSSRASVYLACVVAMATGLLAASCASVPDPSRYTVIQQPSFTEFGGMLAGDTSGNNAGVHTFLENQCGTLDCHGQEGRPFRLYSANGLRAANDAGLVSGSGGDTEVEVYANFLSAIGLEPEQMSAVVLGQAIPRTLLLVAKPLGLEHHKGGVRIEENDNTGFDGCLEGWLADTAAVANGQGSTFSASQCMAAAAVQ